MKSKKVGLVRIIDGRVKLLFSGRWFTLRFGKDGNLYYMRDRIKHYPFPDERDCALELFKTL